MLLNKRLYLLLLFLFSINCFGGALPQVSLVPGGVAVVPLHKGFKTRPQVFYHQHKVLLLKKRGRWIAVVGIPLTVKPGIDYLIVNSQQLALKIKYKSYPKQHIKLRKSKKKYIVPPKSFYGRLKRERKIINAGFAHWRRHNNINMRFLWPVKGRISGVFGVRRFYNGVEKGRHRGLDIAAPRGRVVKAPASGVVLNDGRYYFTGHTIMLDHGQGLITIYCHLNKILVHSGEYVRRGQIIGRIGSTGRSTGPHLHLGVSLNQTRVDPLLFLRKL
ncbi:MAG: peptidoglycan DD-metalloendopeptidase family protein [Gammaproteobacteria bacterium]|nr:peptidoglycan DD-metalloendopeptidase family protein [Gammaproteobacteria bacterium]